MINRNPVKFGLLGFVLLLILYALAKDPVYLFAQRCWYDFAYRQNVQDRAALALRCQSQNYCFGMYRPELPWEYGAFFTVAQSVKQRPQIISWYQAWGDRKENAFKTEAFDAARTGDLIPLVTWEPWISGFSRYRGQVQEGSLAHIVAGEFDGYIRSWARQSVRYGHPYFLRPLHEASNPWYEWSPSHGNTPALYVAAWRHIVDIFRKEGAYNVAFVWTPYTPADTVSWPGDEWVDWIGLDLFNYGTLIPGGVWNSFSELAAYHLTALAPLDKPILATEVATTGFGGNPVQWWHEAFAYLNTPRTLPFQALVVFDNPAGMTPTGLTVDWRMPTP